MIRRIAFLFAMTAAMSMPVVANSEGATLVTENRTCSQIAGTCTTTTIYWIYTSGQWWPQLITERTEPFVVEEEKPEP